MEKKLKFSQSVLIGAIVVCVFVPTITIAAELSEPLKGWLKSVFFHHWVGKGILSTILFTCSSTLAFFMPGGVQSEKVSRLLMLLSIGALISAAVIVGFFIYEFLV